MPSCAPTVTTTLRRHVQVLVVGQGLGDQVVDLAVVRPYWNTRSVLVGGVAALAGQ